MDFGSRMEQDPTVSSSQLHVYEDEERPVEGWKLLEMNEIELKQWLQDILSSYCNRMLITTKAFRQEKFMDSRCPKPFLRRVLDKVVNSLAFLGGGKPEKKEEDAGFSLLELKCGFIVPSFDHGQSQAGSVQVEIKYQLGNNWIDTDHIKIHAVKFLRAPTPASSGLGYFETIKREIDCYTRIFPKIDSVGHSSPFPICYYAKYETEQLSSDILFRRDNEMIQTTEAVLVFQDLEKCDFVQKKTALTVAEGKAVLKVVASIHAATWVMQETSGRNLLQEFPFLIDSQAAVRFYANVTRPGLKVLASRIRTSLKDEAGMDFVMEKIDYWQKNLHHILQDLLGPSTGPSAVLHMDLRLGNIHFRLSDDGDNEQDGTELEVKVTGWQLASYGSTIHDVAFFLLSSFKTQDRRIHAPELILAYYEAFIEVVRMNGLVAPFGLNELYEEYDRSLLLSILIVAGNVDSEGELLDSDGVGMFVEAVRDVIRAGVF